MAQDGRPPFLSCVSSGAPNVRSRTLKTFKSVRLWDALRGIRVHPQFARPTIAGTASCDHFKSQLPMRATPPHLTIPLA